MTSLATLGRDEQTPGALFVRLFDPTDFDNAYTAIYDYMKPRISLWQRLTFGALFSDGLKEWLHGYINASHALGQALQSWNQGEFLSAIMEQAPNLSEDETQLIIDAFLVLDSQGKIPKKIRDAYMYRPDYRPPIVQWLSRIALYGALGYGTYQIVKAKVLK